MPMSYNAWMYGYANPVNNVDPSGLLPQPIPPDPPSLPIPEWLVPIYQFLCNIGFSCQVDTQNNIVNYSWDANEIMGLLGPIGMVGAADDFARALQRVKCTGKWTQKTEFMSKASREYQRLISGRTDDLVFKLDDYTFDAFDSRLGLLKEAKAIPERFINPKTREFKPWLTGTEKWLTQAKNQISVADGLQIQWYFDSEIARDAMYNLFQKNNPDLLKHIDLIYQPLK